jgi:regulation of enolase protein 1 (concanavalin A-like superfamily)
MDLTTKVLFSPLNQYDKAGLMIRESESHWVKASAEYEPNAESYLGAVVTTAGYSDWSTQGYPSEKKARSLRINFEDELITVWYMQQTDADVETKHNWTQIRMAPFALSPGGELQCGLYACSPRGKGFRAKFL